jgi:hypothetical protein
MDDAGLLAASAVGDREAFASFYRCHLPAVLRFLLRETGDRELSADLAAEVFAAALLAARAGCACLSTPARSLQETHCCSSSTELLHARGPAPSWGSPARWACIAIPLLSACEARQPPATITTHGSRPADEAQHLFADADGQAERGHQAPRCSLRERCACPSAQRANGQCPPNRALSLLMWS